MSRLNTLKRILTDRDYRIVRLAKAGFYNHLDDKTYLKKVYRAKMGRPLNLEDPKLFSEKLQWLKLYDRNPMYTRLVDKYQVREYIAEKLGEEYLIPLLGTWDDPDEIDFDALPDQFVLKCNHNSGTGMCICRDKSKLNYDQVRKDLRKGLRENHYLKHREWPYKDVPRRIIAEAYMSETSETDRGLDDFRVYCFNGEPKLVYMYQSGTLSSGNRPNTVSCDIFDVTWQHLPVRQKTANAFVEPLPPTGLREMLEISRQLSEGYPFLRVDFYEINGRVYIGELTMYPGGGFSPFYPSEWDHKLGTWMTLPKSGQ